MSVGEAYRLAHLLRQSEHQPTFSISAKTLPCIAAEDIEISAADRGVHWPGNSGRVEAKILEGGDQYQAQIKVGPFFCAGSEGGALFTRRADTRGSRSSLRLGTTRTTERSARFSRTSTLVRPPRHRICRGIERGEDGTRDVDGPALQGSENERDQGRSAPATRHDGPRTSSPAERSAGLGSGASGSDQPAPAPAVAADRPGDRPGDRGHDRAHRPPRWTLLCIVMALVALGILVVIVLAIVR